MGQVIKDTDTSKFLPSAQLKLAGATITGYLKEGREIKTKFGLKKVQIMEVTDADCKFMKGDTEAFPQPGEKVEFIPSTRLERQLLQVPVGSKIFIKYEGRKDTGGANPAHVYHVEVL